MAVSHNHQTHQQHHLESHHNLNTIQPISLTAMHFLLFGATGRTGQHVLSHALASGHTVTALVRDSSKLTAHSGLTTVIGTPLEKDDILKAYSATPSNPPTAAIITLNTVRESDSPFAAQVSPPRFLADSCASICEVLQQHGCRRIIIMSTAGVGDSWNNLSWLGRGFMGLTNVKYALKDHNLVDQEVRQTKAEWTLVRPVKLRYEDQNASSEGKLKILGSDGKGMKLSDTAGNAAVARFLVQIAVEGTYIRKTVVVTD